MTPLKKSLHYFIFMLLVALTASISLAQTVTFQPEKEATSSPTVTQVEESDVELLKEKIANKVSEIRKKNNRALAGFVLSNDGKTIKIKSDGDADYQIKLDEALTKYYKISGASKSEIKPEDIVKNDYIIISGVIADKIVSANSIIVDEKFISGWGKISEVNADNFNLKVEASDKTVYSLDIESTTKQQMLNIKTLTLGKSGFSKIKEGDMVHFVVKGQPDNKNNEYSAQKILLIPQEYFIK